MDEDNQRFRAGVGENRLAVLGPPDDEVVMSQRAPPSARGPFFQEILTNVALALQRIARRSDNKRRAGWLLQFTGGEKRRPR
jgi:hypothetical protein